MEMTQQVRFFLELLACTNKLNYWQFDREFHLIGTTHSHAEMLDHMFFSRSAQQKHFFTHAERSAMPMISSAQSGVEWATVIERKDGRLEKIHVLGPLFTSDVSERTFERMLAQYQMSNEYRRELMEVLADLPVLPAAQFFPYVQMLHYCVTGEKVSFSDIRHEALLSGQVSSPGELQESYRNSHAGIYAAEQSLMKMIEEGNLDYKSAMNEAVMRASAGSAAYADDPLRKGELMGIKFITLSVRAAIRGGVPPAIAYTVGDYYETEITACTNITDAANVLSAMYEDFIHRVRKCRNKTDISKPIQICRDYIDMHLVSDFSLGDLARIVGYSEYYLTRKFKREMGVSVWEYTNKAKVERAKSLLADGALTIQEIGDMLQYCSRSYFSEIFQKYTGVTPSVYRKKELKM